MPPRVFQIIVCVEKPCIYVHMLCEWLWSHAHSYIMMLKQKIEKNREEEKCSSDPEHVDKIIS